MRAGDHDAVYVIHDKDGDEYHVFEIKLSTYTRFDIRSGKTRAAQVNWSLAGECLFIHDIEIKSDAIRPPWFAPFGLFEIPPVKFRMVNFRGRGLGTALIQLLVKIARANSASRIEGYVKSHDFVANPDLPDWYRRRGFKVAMNDGSGVGVASLRMELRRCETEMKKPPA